MVLVVCEFVTHDLLILDPLNTYTLTAIKIYFNSKLYIFKGIY